MSDLAKKLQIKAPYRVLLANAPAGYAARLRPLPDGATLHEEGAGPFDGVLLFVRNVQELDRHGPKALRAVKPDGLLWIAYPKQSAKVTTDITRDRGWDILKAAGYRPVAQVAIDETWSALRFRAATVVKPRRS